MESRRMPGTRQVRVVAYAPNEEDAVAVIKEVAKALGVEWNEQRNRVIVGNRGDYMARVFVQASRLRSAPAQQAATQPKA